MNCNGSRFGDAGSEKNSPRREEQSMDQQFIIGFRPEDKVVKKRTFGSIIKKTTENIS